MIEVFYITLLLVSAYFIGKRHFSFLHPLMVPSLLVGKFLYAVFFLFVFSYHYGGGVLTEDAGAFFKEAKILYEVFFIDPNAYFTFITGIGETQELIDHYLDATTHWNSPERFFPNDSRNVIRLNSLLLFLTQGSIFSQFLLFSFVTFLGSLDLFQWLRKKSNLPPLFSLLLLTLLPSIAFWGSSVIKEPMVILGLCLVFRATFDQINWKRKIWRWVIGFSLMLLFKPYVLTVLFPALLFYVFSHYVFKNKVFLSLIVFSGITLAGSALTGHLDKAVRLISRQQEDFINVRDGGLFLDVDDDHMLYVYFENRKNFEFKHGQAILKEPTGAVLRKKSSYRAIEKKKLEEIGKAYPIYLTMTGAESGIPVTRIDNSLPVMILMIPETLFNTMLRPLPTDNGSWLKHLAHLENLLLLALYVFALFIFPKKLEKDQLRTATSLVFFSLMLFIIVGWTTPVTGAIVRYKAPGVLAMVIVVILKLKKIPRLSFIRR